MASPTTGPTNNNNNVSPNSDPTQTPTPPAGGDQSKSCITTCKEWTVDPVYTCTETVLSKIGGALNYIKDLILSPFKAIYNWFKGETFSFAFSSDTTDANRNGREAFAATVKKNFDILMKSPNPDQQNWKTFLFPGTADNVFALIEKNFVQHLKIQGITEATAVVDRVKNLYTPANKDFFEKIIKDFEEQGLIKKPAQQ